MLMVHNDNLKLSHFEHDNEFHRGVVALVSLTVLTPGLLYIQWNETGVLPGHYVRP